MNNLILIKCFIGFLANSLSYNRTRYSSFSITSNDFEFSHIIKLTKV